MNWDQIKNNWGKYRGQIKEHWGALTEDDLHTIVGQRERMVGLLQERCGHNKGQAEKALNEFMNELQARAVAVERAQSF